MKIKTRLLAYCLYQTKWRMTSKFKSWGRLTKTERLSWVSMASWVIRALELYVKLRGK